MKPNFENTNSSDFNFVKVINEALKYESFDKSIKQKFQAFVMANTQMPLSQRLAIYNITEKISLKDTVQSISDGLNKVLFSKWSDVGIDEENEVESPPALNHESRKLLLEQVIMPLFKTAIENEITRLENMLTLTTELDENWHADE